MHCVMNNPTANDAPALQCEDVHKVFGLGAQQISALRGVNLTVARRDTIALIGASGSGKSTLLHILGGLARPTQGRVRVCGDDIHALRARAAGRLRNRALGFVYQFHHLLGEFTAVENVAMPLLIRGESRGAALDEAAQLLTRVGLGARTLHKPGELSGGERQRAAIARAAVARPACILADEPTGNLDSKTAEVICELLLELNRDHQTALLIATHDRRLAAQMTRKLSIEDGVLRDDAS